jgi:hypothetical protein
VKRLHFFALDSLVIKDEKATTVSLSLNPDFIAMLQESSTRIEGKTENRMWNFDRTTQTRIVRVCNDGKSER